MKTLVAPTDFSDKSVNAVFYAADMACMIQADLALVHVCQVPMTFSDTPAPASTLAGLMSEAEERIDRLAGRILDRTGGQIRTTTVVKEGNVVDEINRYCATIDTFAVVMGAERAGAVERFLLGGRSVAAVKHLVWPVIVVPPGSEFNGIRNIGLACDFRKVTETIPYKEIEMLVNKFQTRLHVIHVTAEKGEEYSEEKIEACSWLKDTLDELKPVYHFIGGKDPDKGIRDFIKEHALDLLIVIPKKHSLIHKLFRKSETEKIVLHSPLPVMTIHE